jgi:DNA-binding transcriptional ArsR family regulator
MAAKRVTPQEQKKMWELYKKLGSYAAVARKMKRSPDTVSRHIKVYEAAYLVAAAMEEAKANG